MNKKYVLIGLLLMIVLVGGFYAYLTIYSDHDPSGDACRIDADCVCTSRYSDGCGKPGQTWVCINNGCELKFYTEIQASAGI